MLNNDGIWNENLQCWRLLYFLHNGNQNRRLVYLLFCIAIIYAFIHYRVSISKQVHLAELNQMKLQFLANISHELRTPLSLIISPVENLFAYAANNKGIKDQLELIYRNANRLFRLV
jgi:signal transduction histidine kinase